MVSEELLEEIRVVESLILFVVYQEFVQSQLFFQNMNYCLEFIQ